MNPQLKKLLYIIVIIISLIFIKNLVKNSRNLGIKYDRFIESLEKGDLNKKLLAKNILKKCYNPMIDEFIAQEGFNYEEEDKKAVSDSLKKLYDSNIKVADHLKVPAITHRMYFSNEEKPVLLNTFYIELLKINYSRLNSTSEDWTHYIWTNMPELFPEEIKDMKGVQVKTLEEFKDHKLYNTLITTIEKGKQLRGHYSEASDILRFMAVETFGGFYSDMDFEIYHPEVLYDYMKKFDFIGAREQDNGYYASQFIAAKPNHPIIIKATELLYRNHFNKKNAPDAIKYPCSEYSRIYFNALPLLTVAYFDQNNINNNIDVILPDWVAINFDFARYKNKTCTYTKITKEEFRETENNLEAIIQAFSDKLAINNSQDKESICSQQNIYYNSKYHNNLKIIGADMGCGTWLGDLKGEERINYWNPPWKWNFNKIFQDLLN